MHVLLAQLAPAAADTTRNLERLREVVLGTEADLYVFPELFLSGYRVGDAVHSLALAPDGPELSALAHLARSRSAAIVVGAPVRHARLGEILNAAVLATPSGETVVQGKRFLPTYGPFEEGAVFTPESVSAPVPSGDHRLGLQICYDAFFPEVSRELALAGADLLVVVSAAPVTSRRLFDKVLPARAVENAIPVVYVNRVGVEDGIVFGGGSNAFDVRGEIVPGVGAPTEPHRSDEATWTVSLDPTESARWRPFRPVLRDAAGARRRRPSAIEPSGAPSA